MNDVQFPTAATARPHPRGTAATAALLMLGLSGTALAQEAAPATLNSGDTAWMMISSVLVLMMLVPGLALFYGGMVRAKNVLSVFTQCFGVAGVIGMLWVIYGYSIFSDTTGMEAGVVNLHSFIGGFKQAMLANIDRASLTASIPESVFATFQMTFALITPVIIAGSFAERMKFSAVLLFTALWFTFCYAPLAHMAWSGPGGLLWDWGILEFAGGTVVHINAGVAGLVAALVLGRRRGYPHVAMPPHNLGFALAGAALLWVGWFGFNVGSAVAANENAGMAMLTTQIAACAGVVGWLVVEWLKAGKPSSLGAASGALAGLVAITPACGFVGPSGALYMGLITGAVCFFAIGWLKRKLGYDDSLDAFGLHGIGGIVGSLLTGVFASKSLGGFQDIEIASQVQIQAQSVLFTVLYCAIVTWVLLKLTGLVTRGLRVSADDEQEGLDQSQHNERAYNV
ncbi:ammonium transporter [Azoarcus olearius]|uniref:ammonium transporter n=1 Tax=Azoarcus sp. (strain BH72) TaxID=418699 RepID=UPI00080638C1|nr:ammonium transporter [Azoarcus olearius]ANQ86179.1 ammonium transporter [Azoarcus olearius]